MFKATISLISGGLLGKLLGVTRELLLASLFGTTAPVGAYRMAQTATLIPVQFFTADSLNAGFIPLYIRYARQDTAKAQRLFWALALALILISLVVAGFLFWGSGFWIGLLATGFDEKSLNMAVSFVEVMALGALFFVIGALFSYLEIANGGYTLVSLRSSVQSIGLIIGTLSAFWLKNLIFLAWGFTGAYIFYSTWAGIWLFKQGILAVPSFEDFSDAQMLLNDLWRTLLPLLPLPILLQGTIAVERSVASLMGVSVVAALDYAKFITETGIVLLAAPLGLASLSALSGIDPDTVKERLHKLVPVMLIATIPVSAFLVLHNRLIVQILYGRGAFDAASINLTASILFGLAVGFWAQVAGYVLIKALNAQMRNREVIIYMAVALGFNCIVNVAFYKLLGPLALGLGASAYGLALFLLTARAFRIWGTIMPLLAWLAIGTGLYSLLALLLSGNGWFGLAKAFLLFSLFWGLFIFAVPLLRSSVSPVLSRLIRRPA